MGGLLSSSDSGNYETLTAARPLRQKARTLEQNNGTIDGLLKQRQINIFGPLGIRIECQVKTPAGDLDETENARLEALWARWKRKESCTLNERLSFEQAMILADRRRVIDGGILIRLLKVERKPGIPNFAIELIEVDRIAESLSKTLPNGNIIEQGIERDRIGRIVNYHIKNYQDGDRFIPEEGATVEPIPASEVIHFFKAERAGQTMGVSELASSFRTLHHMAEYERAELIGALAASNYFSVIESDQIDTQDLMFDEEGNEVEAPAVEQMQPGVVKRLLPGEKFTPFTPNRPNSAFVEFWRALSRNIAVAFGTSYESISGDHSQSNYSSSRQAMNTERDYWQCEQSFFIESVTQPIWEAFLQACLRDKLVKAERYLSDEPQYLYPLWIARTWDYIDPTKDIKATIEAIQYGLTTHTDEIAKRGGDIVKLLQKKAAEKALCEKLGVELITMPPAAPVEQQEDPESGKDDDKAEE
jgi:lambda family phage portal protein